MTFQKQILKGKVALITGGATGICYGISRLFLQHGATVYIISRKIDNINHAIQRLKKQTNNSQVYGSSCDVRDQKAVQQTVQKVIKQHGNIDIVVNGAAGNFICPFQNLTPNGFKTVLMIDTVGTFLVSKYTNQYGFKKGNGIIINISANLHYNGTAMQIHSGTAKAGVDAITKHLAVELGPKGIRVVGICPGVIGNTQGFDRLSMGGNQQSISSLIPLQRVGKPEDIGNCALFLCSQAATYITGQTIVVDGGTTLTTPNFPFHIESFVKGYGKPKL